MTKSLGQIAYEAYASAPPALTLRWDELQDTVQASFEAAAQAVLSHAARTAADKAWAEAPGVCTNHPTAQPDDRITKLEQRIAALESRFIRFGPSPVVQLPSPDPFPITPGTVDPATGAPVLSANPSTC